MKKLITYVLPIFNESKTISKLYEVLDQELNKISNTYDFEIIFINDGSKDNSLEKLIELQQKDSRIKVINFSRNFGHQMAITAGLDFAKGDAVIIMDSDLQDPPEVSLELIREWKEGYQIVYAQRRSRQDTNFKKFTAHAFYLILDKLSDIQIPKNTGDFRLMDRKAVDAIREFREKNRFMRGLTSFIGFSQTAVLFDRSERYAGSTGYPLKKMIKFALDGITGFSTVPLKLITQFGFFVSILSFAGIIYALFMRFFKPAITVSGFTLTIISILFIGGVQMIMLGILGTYIGRIYNEVLKRPLYIVESVFSQEGEETKKREN